jgi:ATP-binding cassette subfamily E protein 1
MDLPLRSLSGGELQRLAVVVCLGTPAEIFLLDEPSAALDCEQRVAVAKVIKRWVVSHCQKTAFVVEHDFAMASILADQVIVFSGEPGVACKAAAPQPVDEGFNEILKMLDATMRLDINNGRPCINKKDSAMDREQKKAKLYYQFDVGDLARAQVEAQVKIDLAARAEEDALDEERGAARKEKKKKTKGGKKPPAK